jgi:hypothetical protein
MLLHPLWPPGTWTFADQRDYEEQHGPNTDLQQINDFVKKFGRKSSLPGGGSFEVRLTRTMPTISYFRIDDNAYWAPYLVNEYGHSVPHLQISSSGELFEWLATNFERLWKAADSDLIPLPVDDVIALKRAWAAKAPLSAASASAVARPPKTQSPSRQRTPRSRNGEQ